MATYYVRPDGNDANTGLGSAPNQAWQTIQKALGATGILSGDTVYLAPGRYTESVTVGLVSPTSLTRIIANPTGDQFTGVNAGEVIWSGRNAAGVQTYTTLLSSTSKNFLSFENIHFEFASTNADPFVMNTSSNMRLVNCQFTSTNASNRALIRITSAAGLPINATIDSCSFFGSDYGSTFSTIYITGQNVVDSSVIKNCLFIGFRNDALSLRDLQVKVTNNTFAFISASAIYYQGGSNTYLAECINNLFIGTANGIYTGGLGISENYNRFVNVALPRTNIASGANSVVSGGYGVYGTYHLQNRLTYGQMFSTILGSSNTSFGTAVNAPTIDAYGINWSGNSPDAGFATYRNLSNIGQYNPTERNSSSITIAPGETSRSLYLYLGATGLTHTTTNLSASYTRNGHASVPITLVAQTPTGSYVSGGFCEVSAPYARGTYRLDVPNAAFDFGADDVTIFVGGTNTTNGAVVTCNMQGIAGNIVHIGPFKVIGDGLGSDQPLDIVQGVQAPVSVQLVDANENGVDISGATVEAKVYNAIGSLIATYSCVPVYAADGRCTFQLTTSVTNTAGVYNVTLTRTIGGNIVVFGPMKMIVRAN